MMAFLTWRNFFDHSTDSGLKAGKVDSLAPGMLFPHHTFCEQKSKQSAPARMGRRREDGRPVGP